MQWSADAAPRPSTMGGGLLAMVAGTAIPLTIALAWRHGLFAGLPSSFPLLLASIAAVASVLGLAARALARAHSTPATMLAILGLLGFIAYCEPALAFASGLLALCALAVVPGKWVHGDDSATRAMIVGIAVLSACVGWVLPFPVHDGRAYLALAMLLCLWRRAVLWQRLAALWNGWRSVERDAGGWMTAAACAGFIAGMGLWLPTMNYDDNAAHLILPYQLLRDGYYHLDVSTQAWAVAPWANNVLNGIAALFAGGEARAAVNLIWLAIGLDGAWRLATALGAGTRAALAAVAVYATLPLTGYFTTTMQVDGASAAVLLQLAALLASSGRSLPPAILIGAMLGLLAGLKATNAVYALPAGLWLAWCAVRRGELRWLARVCATALVLGGSSYAYALLVTGNPFFPLFNATFQSPLFPPVNLVDDRWMHESSWRALWGMTYDTGRFGEHYPGAFGLALLALLPALLVETVRQPASRWVALWFLASGVLMFLQIQYIRYLFPAMAVLVVVSTVGLARLVPAKPFALLVAALAVADALLLPATSWLLRDDPWSRLVRQGPAALHAIESEKVPERSLLRRLLLEAPDACIIVANPNAPFGAVAGGQAMVAKDPYDSRMARTYEWASAESGGERWRQVLKATGTSHVLTGIEPAPALQKALEANGFVRVDAEGPAVVWSSADPGARTCKGGWERARDEAHRRFHPGDSH